MTDSNKKSKSVQSRLDMPLFKNGIRVISDSNDLPDNAELWRYIRLGTLLMLLRGKLFVPTISELRHGDPHEARSVCENTQAHFDDLSADDREWLRSRATPIEQSILCNFNVTKSEKARKFREIWDRELADRRRIWCWHQAGIESMALWHIHAREGVAIQSTPARIKAAFDPAFVDTALIARVSYVDQQQPESSAHHFMRPYLIKRSCYQYEREVRVIFPRNSEDPDDRRLLPINPKKLISTVWISPNIPRSEAVELRRSLIQAWRNGSKWQGRDDDPEVFSSASKAVFSSQLEELKLGECEITGITCFGSYTIPFVMCGDFA